jgi:hypothetical protein
VKLAAHGVGLAGTGLAVREAGGHAAFEDVLDKRTRSVPEQKWVEFRTRLYNNVYIVYTNFLTFSIPHPR